MSLLDQLYGVVVVCSISMLVLCHAAASAPSWLRFLRASTFSTKWRTCLNGIKSWRAGTDDSDLVKHFVAKQIVDRRERQMKRAMAVLSGIGCAGGLSVIFALGAKVHNTYTRAQDILVILGYGTVLLGHCRPQMLRNRYLGVWYSVLMILTSAMPLCATPVQSLIVQWNQLLLIFRLVFSVSYQRLPLVTFWNVVYTIASVCAFMNAPMEDVSLWNVQNYVIREVLISFSAVLATEGASLCMCSETRQMVLASMLRGEGAAMGKLLDLVCDVVVELDTELRITQQVPKFAALVTLSPSVNVKGAQLQDFLSESEKGRLKALSTEGDRETEGISPGLLHTTFRDSCGADLSVEIFYVRYQRLDGRSHVLVGIREVNDQTAANVAPLVSHPRRARSRTSNPRVSRDAPPGFSRSPPRVRVSRGTPPVLSNHSLADVSCDADSDQSSESSTKSGPVRYLDQSFARTSKRAQEVSLFSAMLSWNVHIHPVACCSFHALVAEAKKAAYRLDKEACREHLVKMEAQCRNCGLLAAAREVGQTCEACDGENVFQRPLMPL